MGICICDTMDKNIQSLGKKTSHSFLGREDLTGDILKKFNLGKADMSALYRANGMLLDEGTLNVYELCKGVHFIKFFDMHYIKTDSNYIFVIKEINGRKVGVEQPMIKAFEGNDIFDVSYVKLNGNKFEIDRKNDNQKCSIGELRKMFQEFIKLDDTNDKDSGLNEECGVKFEGQENKNKKYVKSKKNRDVKNDGFRENEDKNCFDHNISIDEDSI